MTRRTVADLISGDVYSLQGTASVRDAGNLMCDRRVGAVLVIEDGRLDGIFTERDVITRVMAVGKDPDTTQLSDVVTRDPQIVPPQLNAVAALQLMRAGGYRHLPVVEGGEVKGVISMRDFIGAEFQEADELLDFAELLETDLK